MKKAVARFVFEKYDGKTANAHQWLEIFEKECSRFEITDDKDKIEIFRLFLEKSCVDWYNSMMLRLTMESEWSDWKKKLLHNLCK